MNKTLVYILAGGRGSRLAPLSMTNEGNLPKQYLSLITEKTMLEETLDRVPEGIKNTVIAEIKFQEITEEQIKSKAQAIYEPFGCNTAAAIMLAVTHARSLGQQDEAILFIKTSDHYMDKVYFQRYLSMAVEEAKKGKIVTIGITPDRPETCYGYIKVKSCKSNQVCNVEAFVEKPDLEKAKEYLISGQYFWNSGMFCFSLGTIVKALEKHAPLIYNGLKDVNPNSQEELRSAYEKIKEEKANISLDYAVMEKEAENIILVKADAALDWNDIGSWTSLERYFPTDESGNTLKGEVVFTNCQNCLVFNYNDEQELRLDSLNDLLVINTENGIVICPKNSAQKIKDTIENLEKKEKEVLLDSKGNEVENQTPLPVCLIDCQDLKIKISNQMVEIAK